MKLFCIIVLMLVHSSIEASQEQLSGCPSAVSSGTVSSEPVVFGGMSHSLSADEEQEFCDLALKAVYRVDSGQVNHHVRAHLQKIIQESASPDDDDDSPTYILRKVKSRHQQPDGHELRRLYDMVVQATNQALEEKQKEADQRQLEIDQSFSKTQTVVITSIASVITAGCGVAAAWFSQK